jgi:hypothetical protein
MRVKSAYREKQNNIPPPGNPEPHISSVNISGAEGKPVAAVMTAEIPDAAKADEAALALRRQIEALRQSEFAQRRAAPRERLLHKWRGEGMGRAEERFLRANPAMLDNPQLMHFAANEAAQHHQRGSAAHLNAAREIFHRHMTPATEPTPAFFEPPPPPAPPVQSAIYSAPVSRTVPSAGYREPSPSSVRLTREEQETARMSGISDIEYAKHKLRMEREKAAGERQA